MRPNYTIDTPLDGTRPELWQTVQVERTASGSGVIRYLPLLTDTFEYVSSMEAQSMADELRFQNLAAQWRRETRYLSSSHEIAMNKAYQSIIGMGDRAVPLILRDLKDSTEPDHWFWALSSITHAKPVPDEEIGDMLRMRQRWLDWGRSRGYISDRLTRYAY